MLSKNLMFVSVVYDQHEPLTGYCHSVISRHNFKPHCTCLSTWDATVGDDYLSSTFPIWQRWHKRPTLDITDKHLFEFLSDSLVASPIAHLTKTQKEISGLPAIPKVFQKVQNKSCNNNERKKIKDWLLLKLQLQMEQLILLLEIIVLLSDIWVFLFVGVMGEYEPKIEVQFPEVVQVAKGSTVRLECFALGK